MTYLLGNIFLFHTAETLAAGVQLLIIVILTELSVAEILFAKKYFRSGWTTLSKIIFFATVTFILQIIAVTVESKPFIIAGLWIPTVVFQFFFIEKIFSYHSKSKWKWVALFHGFIIALIAILTVTILLL